jgi:hypothetical protein
VPLNNVGLLVNFRLGDKSLLAFVRGLGSMSLVMSSRVIPIPAPTVGNRGNLLGLWVIGWVVCALEFHISVLNRVKVSKIGTVSSVVQAWVDQKLVKCDILRVFFNFRQRSFSRYFSRK